MAHEAANRVHADARPIAMTADLGCDILLVSRISKHQQRVESRSACAVDGWIVMVSGETTGPLAGSEQGVNPRTGA